MNEAKLKDGERVNQLFSTDVKIIQNSEVFSYSVDSVLLSRFPKLPQRGLIVDLCAGNGAVGTFCQHSHQGSDSRSRDSGTSGRHGRALHELNDLTQQMQVIRGRSEKPRTLYHRQQG